MLILLPMALSATPPAPPPVEPLAPSGPPVDWVFVLDTAGDMLPLAQGVRGDIAALVERLPEGDRVEVMVTHTRAGIAMPLTAVRGGERAAIVQQLRDLDLKTAADPDLGAGIVGVQGELEGVGASALVFFVGRFCHDPTVASEYDTGGHGCRTIRGMPTLVDAGKKLRADKDLLTRLFPIAPTGSSADPGGIDAARQAFAGEVVREPAFGPWLRGFTEHLAAERQRPVAQGDLARAIVSATVTDPGTPVDPRAKVSLSTGLRLLELHLDNLKVDGAEPQVSSLVLAPAATLDLVLPEIRLPFALFPAHDTVVHDLKLTAEASLEPASLVRELGLSTALPKWTAPVRVEVPRDYGLPNPIGILILGALGASAAGTAVWWRLRSIPRELGGTFHWRRGVGPRIELEIAHQAEAGVVVEGDSLTSGPAARAVLVFRVSGPRWRPTAEVEVRLAGVELNRKSLPPGRHPVTPGAASFQFGEFRLVWE